LLKRFERRKSSFGRLEDGSLFSRSFHFRSVTDGCQLLQLFYIEKMVSDDVREDSFTLHGLRTLLLSSSLQSASEQPNRLDLPFLRNLERDTGEAMDLCGSERIEQPAKFSASTGKREESKRK
jgi:hypothetical protein